MERIIGVYEGAEPGALVLAFAAMHGNEIAGIKALEEVFRLLDQEPEVNPGFRFYGNLIGLTGNVSAMQQSRRFIHEDINRLWSPRRMKALLEHPAGARTSEETEAIELLERIHAAIQKYRPEALILIDLHTTSAEGGIFCIPSNDPASLRLAKELHAPVILGMLDGIDGTLLHYATGNHFAVDGFPAYSVGVAFEGGQHNDPLSVSRCIAAVINCLRASGCVRPEDVDTRHDALLLAYANDLPKVTRLRYVHKIQPDDGFNMRPGYINFQPVHEGEHIADDKNGAIRSPYSGRILMPLYQPQGTDGFFIIQDLEEDGHDQPFLRAADIRS